MCNCKKKCNKCCKRKASHPVLAKNNSSMTITSNGYHSNSNQRPHHHVEDEDDYDMSDESITSKLCKIICVSTVIFFEIFLFVGCYQQSLTLILTNQCLSFGYVMIGFYVYGKMLLYAYFILRAYNMLEGSQLNYRKGTVILILSIYFIMMNIILFIMIYIHLTEDWCTELTNQYNKKRTLVFGIAALIDGSLAIKSVLLLVHKLFALVRQSMNVSGGIEKITPHPSPLNTPRNSILQSHPPKPPNYKPTKHTKHVNMQRLQSTSSISRSSVLSTTSPHTKRESVIKAYKFDHKKKKEIHAKLAMEKEKERKYSMNEEMEEKEDDDDKNGLSKQIQTNHHRNDEEKRVIFKQHQQKKTKNIINTTKRKKKNNVFIVTDPVAVPHGFMSHIRRCSASTNDSGEDSNTSNQSNVSNMSNPSNVFHVINGYNVTNTSSAPSSTRQSKLENRRISRSITPEIDHHALEEMDEGEEDDDDDDDEERDDMGLQSILSDECLLDENIDKVKKLSIGRLLEKDDLIELAKYKEYHSPREHETDNDGFSIIEEEEENINETDKMIENDTTPDIISFEDHNSHHAAYGLNLHLAADIDDNDDDEEEDEEEMKEISPLASSGRDSIINMRDNNSGTRNTLQPPSSTKGGPFGLMFGNNTSNSPRNASISISRRSSSFYQASKIKDVITNEHIRRFHSVTRNDNELLLLSTKLLILLTICVISSFCSFLLLFGIVRVNQNNGIFFVYGIDSFINIWCLSFTFKFSHKYYNLIFNCGNSYRSTKLCFPMVKTAALTWKFCCCSKTNQKLKITQNVNHNHHHMNGNQKGIKHKNGHHPVQQYSTDQNMYKIEEHNNDMQNIRGHNNNEDKEEVSCRMNCCCCFYFGNENEVSIYHMSRREVELMLSK